MGTAGKVYFPVKNTSM